MGGDFTVSGPAWGRWRETARRERGEPGVAGLERAERLGEPPRTG